MNDLETRALQAATDVALKGMDHGSTICHVPKGAWHADIIRAMSDIPQAAGPISLAKLMAEPGVAIIFVPASAAVTAETVESVCRESALAKTIILEDS